MVSEQDGSRAETLQSLSRGLSVIRCFGAEHSEQSLSDVARRADVSRATARRILHTLQALGYVRATNGRFALTPRVLELGGAYLASSSVAEVARPHLQELTAVTDESSSLSELDGGDIVYLARVERRRIMRVTIGVGTRFPAYATSMGRVLLAGWDDEQLARYLAQTRLAALTPSTITEPARLRDELAEVRRQGWALVDEELEVGLRSVAAPVRDAIGTVVAAVNVSTTSRRPVEDVKGLLVTALLVTAAAITADIGAIGARSG